MVAFTRKKDGDDTVFAADINELQEGIEVVTPTAEGDIVIGGAGGVPAPLAVGADAHALVSTGTTRVNRRLAAWDVTWSGATAYEMSDADGVGGTAYASMVDSAAALQAANDRAALLGLPLVGNGRYRVDSLVTFTVPFDFADAEFVCNDTALDPLIRVGTATSGVRIRNLRGYLPRIVQAAKTGLGWTGASAGVELSNLYQSKIWGNRVRNFTAGMRLRGIGTGCTYNDIFPGHLDNNKINLHLFPGAAGWVNQNEFFGGRISHDGAEGTLVVGVKHVFLEDANDTGSSQPNGNSFYGTSVEGDVPEFTVHSLGAIRNRFIACRWESTSNARCFWDEKTTVRISQENEIEGGYAASTIVHTHSVNSLRYRFEAVNRNFIEGSTAVPNALYEMRNSNGSTSPVFHLFDGTVSPLDTTGANWTWEWASAHLRAKRVTDSQPRFSIQQALNFVQLRWGPGAAVPQDTDLDRAGAKTLKVNGSFYGEGVISRTTAYTTLIGDHTILGDATSAAFTVTLITAVGNIGKTITIKKTDASANAVTVDANGTQTIDGALTKALGSQWAALSLVSDGANWVIASQMGTIT